MNFTARTIIETIFISLVDMRGLRVGKIFHLQEEALKVFIHFSMLRKGILMSISDGKKTYRDPRNPIIFASGSTRTGRFPPMLFMKKMNTPKIEVFTSRGEDSTNTT